MEPWVQQIAVPLVVAVLISSGLWALVHKRADKYNSKVVLASDEVLAFLEAVSAVQEQVVQQDTMDADAAVATSKYYSVTLAPAGWSASGSAFKYTYSNTSLRASVSPVVSCTENAAEYAYITDAEATAKTGQYSPPARNQLPTLF